MRDYSNFDMYLNMLVEDIYPQPEDPGHSALAQKVIYRWMGRLTGCTSVLDVGCGTAFCQDMFQKWNVAYRGVCLGQDYTTAREMGRMVSKMDFHFMEFRDNSYDLLFARHSLEHSPMPLLALMEWYRVSRQWLGLVLPAPEHYTYKGLNHYSVMNRDQIENLLERAGWKPIWFEYEYKDAENQIPQEYWIMCEKRK